MSKNKKRFFGHLKKEGKRKSKFHRTQDRNDKRAILDLLMELDLYPEPKQGGWISFECPICCQDRSAVVNCNIVEFYCSFCQKSGTIPHLMIAAQDRKKRGLKIEFKKNDNSNAGGIAS